MYAFITGMERCGTHSAANIIRSAAKNAYVTHEEQPTLCKEAKLAYEIKDFRTPDLKKKIAKWRQYHKKHDLVCEANHRLSFFISLLAREFAQDGCRIVFLVREPLSTIISRIATWAHYKRFLGMYPEFYLEGIKSIPENKKEFNEYRLSPPDLKELTDLYTWEWIETYKRAREHLNTIPLKNRKVFFCEELTNQFEQLLEFIGMDYFHISDETRGWARVKSDSIYKQEKINETDVFVTQERDETDKTIIFAKEQVEKNKERITSQIISVLGGLPHLDDDLKEVDRKIISLLPEITRTVQNITVVIR